MLELALKFWFERVNLGEEPEKTQSSTS